MRPTEYRFGFRVLGPATEPRRLIDWPVAFRAYAACDPRAGCAFEAYLSAFVFAPDFRRHLEDTGSTKGFAGWSWAPFIWWDIDRDQLGAAVEDSRRLFSALTNWRGIADGDVLLFLSGNKGLHFGLPTALWNPPPGELFHRVARRFAEHVAERAGVTIDIGVYDRVRLFRAPNSKHPKTGLYKHRLAADELMHLSADALRGLAVRPEPFEIPEPTATSAAAAEAWHAAAEHVQREAAAKAVAAANGHGSARLNRGTLTFVREGAVPGDRHRLLYSSAANLRDSGAPPALVHELLTEAALDTGLSPSEVRRCIDNALAAAEAAGGTP